VMRTGNAFESPAGVFEEFPDLCKSHLVFHT
jgi:hypothetical protein